MLNQLESAKEKWGGVSEVVDRWLQERQELLVQYCDLSATSTESDAPSKLQGLCEILVDYVSAGHFEIYDKLIQEAQDFDDQEAIKKASKEFSKIDQTTEHALDFNDKYLETDDLTTIDEDLSTLGEALAIRFEAEDQMIEVLHNTHKGLTTE